MNARNFIAPHAPANLLDRALVSIAAHCIWLSARLRARRAFRRWSTPEERCAFERGQNHGAAQGILYISAILALLMIGLWLAGAGL